MSFRDPTDEDARDVLALCLAFRIPVPASYARFEQRVNPAAQMRSTIDRVLARGPPAAKPDGSTHSVRSVSVTAPEAAALTSWVLGEKPTHTIEIGLAFSVSALAICAGLVEAGDASPLHVVLDDYDLPGVRRTVSFFVSNLGWRLEETSADDRHRWAVVRTAAGEDERGFRYFVEF